MGESARWAAEFRCVSDVTSDILHNLSFRNVHPHQAHVLIQVVNIFEDRKLNITFRYTSHESVEWSGGTVPSIHNLGSIRMLTSRLLNFTFGERERAHYQLNERLGGPQSAF